LSQYVFATGMFRSGTTLLARMFDANESIAFASDPFAPVYKAFRNAVVSDMPGAPDPQAPLDDYYFEAEKQQMFERIRQTSWAQTPAPDEMAVLRSAIAERAEVFAPKVVPLLDQLVGDNFADLVAASYDIIAEAYGTSDTTVTGSKEVWTGEFAWHLLDAFPDARVVYIVRDPRAVSASKNAADTKYPWLFLARQWRKLAALGWLLTHESFAHRDRVMLLRYEDLIESPEQHARDICRFVGVPYSEAMVDVGGFRDGAGNKWFQNSTHFERKSEFNRHSIDRWRDLLTDQEIAFIELVCAPEMSLFDYVCETESFAGRDFDLVANPPCVTEDSLAEWMRSFVQGGQRLAMADAACEFYRRRTFVEADGLDAMTKQKLCLSAALFNELATRERLSGG
jgi:hypothetical protein